MRKEAEPSIKMFKDINRKQSRLIKQAVSVGFLGQSAASDLWQLWQDSIDKLGNQIVTLDNIAQGGCGLSKPEKSKQGRRFNLAIEFLFYSLKKDAETFAGRPHYSEICNLLSSLTGEDRYDVPTLRGKGKHPIFAGIPTAISTPSDKKRFEAYKNSFIFWQTLEICKAHFRVKGETFLPDPLPSAPKGQVREILESFDLIPPQEPRRFGINIPRR